jgi:hypothetical protein
VIGEELDVPQHESWQPGANPTFTETNQKNNQSMSSRLPLYCFSNLRLFFSLKILQPHSGVVRVFGVQGWLKMTALEFNLLKKGRRVFLLQESGDARRT